MDKYNIIPRAFSKNDEIFIQLEVLALVITAYWFLPSNLTYFWRNTFSMTLINTQHRGLWDTLGMMLFTKTT